MFNDKTFLRLIEGKGQFYFTRQARIYLRQFDVLLENYSNRGGIKKFNKVNVKFIENPSFNAISILSDESNYLGIYEGYEFIMMDLFNKILSHKSTFLEIGKPESECFDSPFFRNYYEDLEKLIDFGNLDYREYSLLIPASKQRHHFAQHLLFFSILFIFHHELYHYLNGHLHFIKNYGEDTMMELNLKGKNKVPNLISQTLEYDADAMAINRCLAMIVHTCKNSSSNLAPDIRAYYSNVYDAVFYLLFAVYTSFKVVNDCEYDFKKEYEKTHPPTRLRQLMTMATAQTYLQTENFRHLDMQKISDSIFNAAKMSEDYYTLLTGISVDKGTFNVDKYGRHPLVGDILLTWKEIRPELEKHAFAPLAP